MIKSKKDYKEYVAFEKKKYNVSFIDRIFKVSELSTIWNLQLRLRKTEYYKNCNKKVRYIISMVKLKKIEKKYAIHIPLNTCDKGLKIMHIGPIMINGNARIGENAVLHVNTAIVAGGTNDYTPVLGDNIIVGIGAVILGNVRLANNIAIGANAVVNKSFYEDNITIAGVPAKKISNHGSEEWNSKPKNLDL